MIIYNCYQSVKMPPQPLWSLPQLELSPQIPHSPPPILSIRKSYQLDRYVSSISEITPHISLGSMNFTEEDLKRLGITHILNISNVEDPNYPGINSLFIPMYDGGSPCNGKMIDDCFCQTFDFIKEAVDLNGKVLVHCHMGISRSATIVIAYLMKTQKKTYREIMNFVLEKRPIVDPCFIFEIRLIEFQKKIEISSPIN